MARRGTFVLLLIVFMPKAMAVGCGEYGEEILAKVDAALKEANWPIEWISDYLKEAGIAPDLARQTLESLK